jgi:hypothetical protein
MKRLHTTVLSLSVLVAGTALSGQAMAQATWNLFSGSVSGNGCSQSATYAGDYNNSYNCTGSTGVTATASAWSADRGTGTDGLAAPASGAYYASAFMAQYGNSGFGAASRTEGIGVAPPDHSFDSLNPGTQDLMLLDFGSTSVILNQIGIGWKGGPSNQADITVMRWTGNSAPGRVTTSSTRSTDGEQNLISTGWSLVGSYADLTPDSILPFGGTPANTGATQASSWWLISTFNTALNGGVNSCKTSSGTAATCSQGNDAFKLNFISATVVPPPPPGKVPEPGSLALAGIALAGLFGVRRRAAKRA